MKGYLSIAIFLSFFVSGFAQFDYLRLSPAQKIEQRVGLTDVTIEFFKPHMRDREIFGALVPYDELWRTGANKNTKITFSHRVKIGNQEIEKGSYSLFTKPGKSQWEIYFYEVLDQYGLPDEIDSSRLQYLTTVPSFENTRRNEALEIIMYNIDDDSAEIGISWDKTEVRVPIHFYTLEIMEAKINQARYEGAVHLEIAAAYYNDRDIELEKAKELIELAISLKEKPHPTSHNIYGVVLYKLGEVDKAIKAIEYSLKLANEIGYNITAKKNEDLLKAWKK